MSSPEKYLSGIDLSKLPPQARELLIATGQHFDKEPVTVLCPKCQKTLQIVERGRALLVSCECGYCNDTIRGLLK